MKWGMHKSGILPLVFKHPWFLNMKNTPRDFLFSKIVIVAKSDAYKI